MKIEESLNVFDETPPPSKTPPLVDDDLDEEEAIKVIEKKNLENDIEDETLEIDDVVNIKEYRNHPLENVIENLNQRTLRSQARNQRLWYPVGTGIETIVYVNPDHAEDYMDRKSTSVMCTFTGCCLTSWFSKKQTTLAISTTEAEYVVYKDFDDLVYVRSMFNHIGFECLLEINEQIVPHFILEFYSQCRVNYTLECQMLINFVIQDQFFSYTLEEFGQTLDIPFSGQCSFFDKWSLNVLQFSIPINGPYQINPPYPDDIKLYSQEEWEGHVTRIRHDKVIDVEDNQILSREIVEQYNVSYFIAKRMKFFTKYARLIRPYEQNTWKDYGTRRGPSSISFSSTFGQPSSSYLNDDDNDGNDEGTSCASSPSPTRFVNSLSNDLPQIFSNLPNVDPNMEDFYTRQTEILNHQV
nr:retrovirus-related Pol polyprotein from transposon TNT 1-94 [Tanacetum cinerariifolium]